MDEANRSVWTCPDCGEIVDAAKLGFLAEVTCPKCGKQGHANATLANFRLESILGIGGMSVVMRAYDPTLGRPLAIKLLNDTYRDQEDRIRKFESECSLMAKVRHENVVSVYSAGWARGQFYIAMELVNGENLEFIIDRRKFLLPSQAVEIIRQVALGLKAAHEAGLLHRDVKPGNVIITKTNQAKVLDFGLSMEDLQEEDKEEIIWATPFYVPPETLRREREDVRCDIYALGMTLRNLLTGEDKLNGEFHSVTSLLALKEKYPSMRSTYPHLDAELCDFVDRMAAFKPDDRPADYNEVLAELAEVAEHLSKVGQRRAKRLWLAEKKREIMILAGSALLGIILATTVVCSTTVKEVQRYLDPPPAESSNRDWQDITKAENMLLSSKWKSAADLYAKLAERAQDPAAGARAGLLAAALKAMQPDASADAAKCLACASRHLAAAKEAPLLAQGDWQELEQALQLVKEDDIPDTGAIEELRQPMLRVVAYVLSASRAMEQGLTEEADSFVEKAAAEAERGRGGVMEMSTLINRYKLELAHQAVPRLRERVRSLLGRGKLDEAGQGMETLAGLELSAAETAELEVQQELVKVARAAFEAFRKHGQHPEAAVSDPLSFHDAARKVKKDPTFANEMTCLAHMLRGEYSKAFTVDPYKDSADSQKPFAVLMRSWKQKLGRR